MELTQIVTRNHDHKHIQTPFTHMANAQNYSGHKSMNPVAVTTAKYP